MKCQSVGSFAKKFILNRGSLPSRISSSLGAIFRATPKGRTNDFSFRNWLYDRIVVHTLVIHGGSDVSKDIVYCAAYNRNTNNTAGVLVLDLCIRISVKTQSCMFSPHQRGCCSHFSKSPLYLIVVGLTIHCYSADDPFFS